MVARPKRNTIYLEVEYDASLLNKERFGTMIKKELEKIFASSPLPIDAKVKIKNGAAK
jgi:hypothetical protein